MNNKFTTNYLFKIPITAAFMFILSIQAIGQWSTDPNVNNAICDLSAEEALPKVGICSNGDLYIAFLSNVSGSYNIRLQKLDNQGNELWPHNGILISDHPTDSWTSDWDIAVDAADHAILAFPDIRAGGDWQVYAYRVSPTGTMAWGDDGIQLSYSGFNVAPKITCTEAGNSVLAWMSDDVIIMQKINQAGAKQWGTNGITLSSANTLNWPQLLPVGTDDIILKYFYDEGNPPYPTRHIYAQRYNASGAPVWSAPTLISNAGGIASWTQILPLINDGTDGFYIAWHDDRDNNQLSSSFIQHVNSSGQAVWTANGIEVSTLASNNHFYPDLALPTGSSDVFVFWNEMDGDQNQKGISGQKISSSGARLWSNSGMTFIPLSGTSVTPEAVSCSTTDMMVLYLQGVAQLKGMRIATDGSFVWSPNSVSISTASSAKVHTVMTGFSSDQWVVAWEDNRNGGVDIYAQNIAIDGSLGPYEIVYGNIQGHVTLTGGTGNVTQVVVTAGNNSTFPDPTGDYILQVPTGTYTVTASLNGYYTDNVTGVVVLEDQTTANVDFELVAMPTTGWIEGTVELFEGTGDVTQTVVAAGTVTTNPDESGYYIMEVGVGTWDVTATLEGYSQQLHSDVIVEPGETTSDVDFLLTLIPVTGFLYGTVTIEGNMADIIQTIIMVDTLSISPDYDGEYVLEVPVGTHLATAMHQYTESDTATVVIEPGGSTQQDFYLPMLRRDMVVTSHDQFGALLNGTYVDITGPEGNYNGTIENDSLIFSQVPYGIYTGSAIYENASGNNDTTIDLYNNLMDFTIVVTADKGDAYQQFTVSPNPVKLNSTINIKTGIAGECILTICDMLGRMYSVIKFNPEYQQNLPLEIILNNQKVHEGIYLFNFVTGEGTFSARVLIQE